MRVYIQDLNLLIYNLVKQNHVNSLMFIIIFFAPSDIYSIVINLPCIRLYHLYFIIIIYNYLLLIILFKIHVYLLMLIYILYHLIFMIFIMFTFFLTIFQQSFYLILSAYVFIWGTITITKHFPFFTIQGFFILSQSCTSTQ